MPKYGKAGADAAGAYDDEFRQIINNDPDIQRVIQSVWGTGPRPSDTPKSLEKANHAASEQITQILKSKGVTLPDRTFINPRSGNLEGHRGWSGLSGVQKAALIGAASAAGLGGAAALGAFGGAAGGAGAGAASAAASPGVTAGLGGLGTIGTTVPVGGSSMGLLSTITGLGKGLAKNLGGDIVNQLLSGRGLSATGQGLGAIGQTQANNRGAQLEAMLAADEMGLANDRERRADEAGILKQVQQADYIKNGGFKDSGPAISASGKPFTKFDFGVRPTTEAEQDMAGALQGQLMDRLKNPRKLRDYDSMMKPGGVETTMNWLGPIFSTLGAAKEKNESPLQQIMNRLQNTATETPQAPPTPIPDGSAAPSGSSFQPATPKPAGNPWTNVLFK